MKNLFKAVLFGIFAFSLFTLTPALTSHAAFDAPYYNITTDGGKFNGVHYYLNGERIKNAFFCDGTYTYYLQWNGVPMRSTLTYHPDGKQVIYFDEWGHEVFDSFVHVKKNIEGNEVDDLCYFGSTGNLYVNTLTYNQEGTKLYYANPYGVMEQSSSFIIDGNAVNIQLANGNAYGYANADGSIVSFAADEASLKECSTNPTKKHMWVKDETGHICACCGELDYVKEDIRECSFNPYINVIGKHRYCKLHDDNYDVLENQYWCSFCEERFVITTPVEVYRNIAEYGTVFGDYKGVTYSEFYPEEEIEQFQKFVLEKDSKCEFSPNGEHFMWDEYTCYYCKKRTVIDVYSADDLQQLEKFPNSTYNLMNDIDMSDVKANGERSYFVCRQNTLLKGMWSDSFFNGTINGNGHKLYNLKYPLFEYTGSKSNISNIDFETNNAITSFVDNNCGIISNCTYTLQLNETNSIGPIGLPNNHGTMENISIYIDITTPETVSFLDLFANENRGLINNVTVSGSVNAQSISGSLIAGQNGGVIKNCTTDVDIKTKLDWGSICQYNHGLIENCTNNGDITVFDVESENRDIMVGGICAKSAGVIANCVNNGNITSVELPYVSGVVGTILWKSIIYKSSNNGKFQASNRPSVVGELNYIGYFDKEDEFVCKNYICVSDLTTASGNSKAYELREDYIGPKYYTKLYTTKADILKQDYVELSVGEFTTLSVKDKYKEDVKFVPVEYHNNSDDYYTFRELLNEEGYVGLDTSENYNFWFGKQYVIALAYTSIGEFDYAVVKITEPDWVDNTSDVVTDDVSKQYPIYR